MSLHIVLGNVTDRHPQELERCASLNEPVEWTVNSKVREGDLIAFYIRRPLSSFVAVGVASGEPYPNNDPRWPEKLNVQVMDLQTLPEPLHFDRFKFRGWKFSPPQRSMMVKPQYEADFLARLLDGVQQTAHSIAGATPGTTDTSTERGLQQPGPPTSIPGLEGGRRSVVVTKVERNTANREACLANWGYNCQVCGMNFEKEYGSIAREFIHVHHHVLVSEGKRIPDPVNEMSPLCPNCHAVAHLRRPPYRIEELIDMKRIDE